MQQSQDVTLYDIYDVYYEPWFLQSWFIGSVVALVVGGIMYAFYRWYRARTQLEKPYWQKIVDQVQLLEAGGFNDPQLFYVRLTALLKEYLEKRFKVSFIGTTDAECLQVIKTNKQLPEWILTDVQKMFDGIMFVKFAHAQTGKERMQQDITLFKSLMQKTHEKDTLKNNNVSQ